MPAVTGVHLETVFIILRQKRCAGVRACEFARRLAVRIQRTVGPGSETLPEPAAGDGCATSTVPRCAAARRSGDQFYPAFMRN